MRDLRAKRDSTFVHRRGCRLFPAHGEEFNSVVQARNRGKVPCPVCCKDDLPKVAPCYVSLRSVKRRKIHRLDCPSLPERLDDSSMADVFPSIGKARKAGFGLCRTCAAKDEAERPKPEVKETRLGYFLRRIRETGWFVIIGSLLVIAGLVAFAFFPHGFWLIALMIAASTLLALVKEVFGKEPPTKGS